MFLAGVGGARRADWSADGGERRRRGSGVRKGTGSLLQLVCSLQIDMRHGSKTCMGYGVSRSGRAVCKPVVTVHLLWNLVITHE